MRTILLWLGVLLVSCAAADAVEDPLTKDHLSDQIFMKAAWGMKIDDVTVAKGSIAMEATGATFEFLPARDMITCSQRIGKQRKSLAISFDQGTLAGLEVKAEDTGAVILESAGGLVAKVNCDSLLMLRSPRGTTVTCELQYEDEVNYHEGPHRVWVDRFGCVGVYPIDKASLGKDNGAKSSPTYQMDEGGELWIAIGPPRPYPWKESMELRPLWQGSWETPEQAVPSDEKIESYVGRGSLLWLQSEIMLWKSWHEAFEPRLPDGLRRVIDTSHKLGLRVMVYASPFYFTKGVGGNETYVGENVGRYLQAVEDYLKRYPDTDGVYFDGVYGKSVKNTYICCRATRELIGDDRVLMIHCTHNAPGGRWGRWTFNPAADTWASALLRGESFGFVSSEWLRYFVSGYNTSSAIGFVCNNAGHYAPTKEQVEMVLRANARLPYMTADTDGWVREKPINPKLKEPAPVTKAKHIKAITKWYYPRLDESYRAWFEGINEAGAFDVPAGKGSSD